MEMLSQVSYVLDTEDVMMRITKHCTPLQTQHYQNARATHVRMEMLSQVSYVLDTEDVMMRITKHCTPLHTTLSKRACHTPANGNALSGLICAGH